MDPYAYRHFSSCHPTANKLLSQRWENRRSQLHQEKLSTMRPSIDNQPPKVFPHLEVRLRKLKMEQDRIVDIKKKNQILLDRIAFQMVQMVKVRKAHQVSRLPIADRNKHANMEIHMKNLELQKRLGSKTAYYNRNAWVEDRRRNLGYLKNISHFPAQYYKMADEFDHPKGTKLPAIIVPIKSQSAPSRPKATGIEKLTTPRLVASAQATPQLIPSPPTGANGKTKTVRRLVAAQKAKK